MKAPSISMPAIWLWIGDSANGLAQVAEYARESFTSYSIQELKYIPAKNVRLYDGIAWKQSPDVFLMYLVKKGDKEVEGLKGKILSKYRAFDIRFYLEARKY